MWEPVRRLVRKRKDPLGTRPIQSSHQIHNQPSVGIYFHFCRSLEERQHDKFQLLTFIFGLIGSKSFTRPCRLENAARTNHSLALPLASSIPQTLKSDVSGPNLAHLPTYPCSRQVRGSSSSALWIRSCWPLQRKKAGEMMVGDKSVVSSFVRHFDSPTAVTGATGRNPAAFSPTCRLFFALFNIISTPDALALRKIWPPAL